MSLSLPQNIHLLTFEPWRTDSILVRFEHILAKDEDVKYSQEVSFDFKDVFQAFDVVSIRETTLAANQWLDQADRLKFNVNTESENEIPSSTENSESKHDFKPKPRLSARQYFESSKNKFKRHRAAEDDADDYVITLKPMEIRTFVVELEWKP